MSGMRSILLGHFQKRLLNLHLPRIQFPERLMRNSVLLDLAKAILLGLSILSLYPVMLSAFFVPGTRWEDRLVMSLLKIAIAACVCFVSGLLFALRPRPSWRTFSAVFSTLPVRIFFWSMAAMALLFVLSWYLEEYYVPLLWRNQP
jgi:hypothetical protein